MLLPTVHDFIRNFPLLGLFLRISHTLTILYNNVVPYDIANERVSIMQIFCDWC